MTTRPAFSLARHLLLGALTGLLVCGAIGAAEGLRQAWIQLTNLGPGKDAGVFLVLFGPFMAGGYILVGAAIGGGIGAGAGAGLGAALGTARAATSARTDVWGRASTWRLVHAGVWVAFVSLAAAFPAMFDRALIGAGLVPERPAAAPATAGAIVPPVDLPDAAPPRFVRQPSGRVLDSHTNREWMLGGAPKRTALEATRDCKAAAMDLPTEEMLKELLVWQSDGSGRLPPDAPSANEDDAYWTRTPSSYRHWTVTVRLLNGVAEPAPATARHAVLCQVGVAPR